MEPFGIAKQQSVSVSQKELGTNCWSPARFIEGHRCVRIMRCKYPEKASCKALDAEIIYLQEQIAKLQAEKGV